MQMVNSVRSYTDHHVTPLLTHNQEIEQKFIPEVVPSFAAREVFENLRKNKEYKNFFYKDATLNPTNLRDKADEFETDIIERFRKEPKLPNLSGFRNLYQEKLFYSASPFAITQPSCLSCHSTPEAAPKSQLLSYGKENGMGWKLGEVIGTQIIYVPASEVFESAHNIFSLFIKVFILLFALVILLVNFLLKRNVILPIKPLVQIAQKISNNTMLVGETEDISLMNLAITAKRTDELGHFGRIFQTMVDEVYSREQSLKQQVQELYIEIDEAKRVRQVDEIAETEYFQNLCNEAKDIRNQW